MSPTENTIQKDKSVKNASESRKWNKITIKAAKMPNMDKLISRLSRKIADGPADEFCISIIDLHYAYGQLQLSKRAMNLCIFAVTGGTFTGYYQFRTDFTG